jgi:hypothetical protein
MEKNPVLAGKNAAFLAKELQNFRSGARQDPDEDNEYDGDAAERSGHRESRGLQRLAQGEVGAEKSSAGIKTFSTAVDYYSTENHGDFRKNHCRPKQLTNGPVTVLSD